MTIQGDKLKSLFLCDCAGSQRLDPGALEKATGLACSKIHTELCGAEAGAAAAAMASGGCLICCTQEARFFADLADEIGAEMPPLLDLRDRAGWTDDKATVAPKMAALAAEALLPATPVRALDVTSSGTCLVIGPGEVAGEAASALSVTLAVTLLLTDDSAPPADREIDTIRGHIRTASGALGGFALTIDGLARVIPSGRCGFAMSAPRDGAKTECDVILDLSGGTPLFPAPEKREGYLRADPGSAAAVATAVRQASHMVGTFEKPVYVRIETILCAHSRARQTGCSKCLDNCPTSAITPAGDHVAIDPMVCAGCGSCAALCPSGAITYEAPPTEQTFRRLYTLARAYQEAGGTAPRLLAHDAPGAEMIRLLARFGRGLPADVIPFEVGALNTFGHAEAVAAVAAGFASVALLPGPGTERAALDAEVALAQAIAGPNRLALIDETDPDLLGEALYGATAPAPVPAPVRPLGTRRQITRQAARALHPEGTALPLPATAPYGAVLVDTEACTLCLSCVSLCPSGALGDNPDMPQLSFQEDACLQCGLCANICPEDAITYERRLNLSDAALSQVVLHEEEPFACVQCGKLFATKSSVDRITEKLAQHPMYREPGALRTLQMCEDCRVEAQFHSRTNPFAAGDRPLPRTTDDYLSKRKDH